MKGSKEKNFVNSSTNFNLKPRHLSGNLKGSKQNYIDKICLYYLIKHAYLSYMHFVFVDGFKQSLSGARNYSDNSRFICYLPSGVWSVIKTNIFLLYWVKEVLFSLSQIIHTIKTEVGFNRNVLLTALRIHHRGSIFWKKIHFYPINIQGVSEKKII